MFMAKQFYRKVAVCAMLTWAVAGAQAQVTSTDKPKPHDGPRAISVLETDATGHAEMVPVTILYLGQYYDAAQYQANPIPMADVPGNVYDVLQSNLPIGLFTTGQAKEIRGNWVAIGVWKQKNTEPQHKPEKQTIVLADEKGGGSGGGPVLHRRGEKSTASSGSSGNSNGSASSGDDDTDRPTLKRPKSGNDANATPPADEDDADRPTLKRPADEQPATSAPAAKSTTTTASVTADSVPRNLSHDTNENDPDRPVLRRTEPGVNPTDKDITLTGPMYSPKVAAPSKVAHPTGPGAIKQYIAVSDAQKTDYRPFAYELTPEMKTRLVPQLQKVAAAQLQKFALAHGKVKLLPNITFGDYELRAFDVDYSNNPELVFTASYSPTASAKTKPVTYYLTTVVREDENNDLNPIFSQITDSTRLDEFARLELVDAIDPDGMGRGALLFREFNDSGKAFILYRVDNYNLTKLFEGASGE